ncbi:B-box type zinc finger family protein [Striga hermonthica]|uniref:B-box type zinc finger family protein n=1 Tax=Striga hermonthica TaxID=68872 RepID=A0A9N7NIP0_STRHE|nr:B-box type zinc finger family protein [Striga hermonthica]
MKRKCDLCKNVASMYCNSDQASLCWDCDSRIHVANFLVAKHTRTLLCRACQGPTSWTGSGPKLGPTFSVCDRCVRSGNAKLEEDDDDDDDDVEEEDDDDDNVEADDDDDGDNQVVPLSPPRFMASTSSSSQESSSRGEGLSGSGIGFRARRA